MDLNHFLHKTNLNEEEEGWGGQRIRFEVLNLKRQKKSFLFISPLQKQKCIERVLK